MSKAEIAGGKALPRHQLTVHVGKQEYEHGVIRLGRGCKGLRFNQGKSLSNDGAR